MENINCFAFAKDECLALNGVKVPEECKNCHFRKPSRDVTNGKTYALDLVIRMTTWG